MKTYYDIHCHIFNKDVVIRRLVNVVQSLVALKNLVEGEFSEADVKLKIEGINNTLGEVTQETSEEVFNILDNVYNKEVVVTPLMFDLTYADDNDDEINKNRRYSNRIEFVLKTAARLMFIVKLKIKNKELKESLKPVKKNLLEFAHLFDKPTKKEIEIFDNSNYEQQIEDLEALSKKNERVKPFFSVDPRREYKAKDVIMNLVKDKVAGTDARFAGIKLYAPAGFSPTDPVLMGSDTDEGLYGFCQRNKIPITVHNSNGGFACLSKDLRVNGHVYLDRKIRYLNSKKHTFKENFFGIRAGKAIGERAKTLNHPALWNLVMNKFPELVINFAHFGGSDQIMEYVNYQIPEKMEIKTLDKYMKNFSKDYKNLIDSIYKRKRKYMYLQKDFRFEDRKKIWNIMYHAGLIDNWAKAIFEIVRNVNYPNAYTDLSCFSEGKLIDLAGDNSTDQVFTIKYELENFKRNFFNQISAYEKSKILYGSDFFLAQFFGPTMKQYYSDFKEVFGSDFDIIAHEKNAERFLNITT